MAIIYGKLRLKQNIVDVFFVHVCMTCEPKKSIHELKKHCVYIVIQYFYLTHITWGGVYYDYGCQSAQSIGFRVSPIGFGLIGSDIQVNFTGFFYDVFFKKYFFDNSICNNF